MAKEQSTASLIAAIRRGERKAQEQFLRQYAPTLFSSIVRLVGNTAEAEELTQDALLKALQHINEFDPARSRMQTWLSRIASNLAISHLRRRTARPTSPLEDMSDLPDDDAMSPFEAESPSLLEQAMAELPPEDQQLLWLFYYDGLPLQEIAYITDRTPQSLATRLHRLRSRLKRIILKLKNQL